MRYTDAEIHETLVTFIHDTEQPELRYVIPFCLGFYGYITHQIWRVITDLMNQGTIK